jgi:hypothetical protein
MLLVAAVAAVCGVLIGLARTESLSWWLVSPLLVAIGLYLVTAFACGLVLDLVASLGRLADPPREDPSVGHHKGARPEV